MSEAYSNQMPITPPDNGEGLPSGRELIDSGPEGPFFVTERFDELFSTCPYIELDPAKIVGRELSETSVLSQVVNNETRMRYISSVLEGLEEPVIEETDGKKIVRVPDFSKPDYRRKRIKKRYDYIRSPFKHGHNEFNTKTYIVDEDRAVYEALVGMNEQEHPVIPLISSLLHMVPKGLNQRDAENLVKDLVTVLNWEGMKISFDRQIKEWKAYYDAMPKILELMRL